MEPDKLVKECEAHLREIECRERLKKLRLALLKLEWGIHMNKKRE